MHRNKEYHTSGWEKLLKMIWSIERFAHGGFPDTLMAEQKQKRVDMCTPYLAHFNEGGGEFLARTVTGNKSWMYHFTPLSKAQLHPWWQMNSWHSTKVNLPPSIAKVVALFFDINSTVYCDLNHKNRWGKSKKNCIHENNSNTHVLHAPEHLP